MKYIKESLKNTKPYSVKHMKEGIIMNANESPFDLNYNTKDRIKKMIDEISFNRYPDTNQSELIYSYIKKNRLSKDEVIFSVGADGIIDAVFKAVITKGDKVVTITPTFTMYKEYSKIYEAEFIEVPLNENFNFTLDLLNKVTELEPRLVIICTPNNPTGTVIDNSLLEKIIKSTKGIVLIDAAYSEFGDISYEKFIKNDNVIVVKTTSKAYGLAGIRLGFAISNPNNIAMLRIVIPPYALSSLTLGIGILFTSLDVSENIKKICIMRDRMYVALSSMGIKVFPSKTNFLFFEANNELVTELEKYKIYVKEIIYDNKVYIRMTLGKSHENDIVLRTILNLFEKVYKI